MHSSSGSVIVKNGKIIGRGKGPLGDPIAHAEVQAVRDAHSHLGTTSLNGCVLYSSAQPCPDVSVITLFNKRGKDRLFYVIGYSEWHRCSVPESAGLQ